MYFCQEEFFTAASTSCASLTASAVYNNNSGSTCSHYDKSYVASLKQVLQSNHIHKLSRRRGNEGHQNSAEQHNASNERVPLDLSMRVGGESDEFTSESSHLNIKQL